MRADSLVLHVYRFTAKAVLNVRSVRFAAAQLTRDIKLCSRNSLLALRVCTREFKALLRFDKVRLQAHRLRIMRDSFIGFTGSQQKIPEAFMCKD